MNDAINSFGLRRIALMHLARDQFRDRRTALNALRESLGPYDSDGNLEIAVDAFFADKG